jgi:hypothetical protein
MRNTPGQDDHIRQGRWGRKDSGAAQLGEQLGARGAALQTPQAQAQGRIDGPPAFAERTDDRSTGLRGPAPVRFAVGISPLKEIRNG